MSAVLAPVTFVACRKCDTQHEISRNQGGARAVPGDGSDSPGVVVRWSRLLPRTLPASTTQTAIPSP